MHAAQTHHQAARRDAGLAVSIAEERFPPSGVVVGLTGELDIATAPAVGARLQAAIGAGATRVVVDLRAVDFMDSVALATILSARKQLGDDGRMAVVVDPASYVQLLFEVAGLPRCLDLFETRAAAIDHLTG
jgi:anti-anti-sigma factor